MTLHRPLAAVLLAGLLLAGCGDNDKDPEPKDPAGSSSPSPTETGPEPADGIAVDEPTFSFHLPSDWKLGEPDEFLDMTTITADTQAEGDFTDLSVHTHGSRNFEDVRQISPKVVGGLQVHADGKVQQQPVTDWAGQPAYHLVAEGGLAGHMEEFGVIWKDKWIVIRFDFTVAGSSYAGKLPEFELTPEEQLEIIDSIEASWEWK